MRGTLWVAVWALAAAGLVGSAASYSGGAQEGRGEAGCTPCHGALAGKVRIDVSLPKTYEPGKTYNATLTIVGAADPLPVIAANHGGFAMEASAGTLEPSDAKTKMVGKTLTHTDGGNDQRSWSFRWVAPKPAVGKVTFFFSGNGVNGNRGSDGDEWNKGTFDSAPAPGPNATTTTPSAPAEESPGPAAWTVVGVFVAAAFIRGVVPPKRGRPGR